MSTPCLTKLKDIITFDTNTARKFYDDPKKLIGYNEHDVYPYPYNISNIFIEIIFGKKYIKPFKLMLIGTRVYNGHYLKSWILEGKNRYDKWEMLYNCSGCLIKREEEHNFKLNTKRTYSAIKLTMQEKNSYNVWALCLGQIELYGIIYDLPKDYISNNPSKLNKSIIEVLLMIIICTS